MNKRAYRQLTEEQAREIAAAPRVHRVIQILSRLHDCDYEAVRAARDGRTFKYLHPLRTRRGNESARALARAATNEQATP